MFRNVSRSRNNDERYTIAAISEMHSTYLFFIFKQEYFGPSEWRKISRVSAVGQQLVEDLVEESYLEVV